MKVGHAVGRGNEQHDAKRERANRLLMFELPIHCDKDVKLTGCTAEQFAIGNARPPEPGHGVDFVAAYSVREPHWQILIEKYAHPGRRR